MPGTPVLPPGRRKAVPVDQARLVDLVLDAYPEGRPDLGPYSKCAVGLADAEDRSGLSVHPDGASCSRGTVAAEA